MIGRQTVEEWEDTVFREASHFTIHLVKSHRDTAKANVMHWPQVLRAARTLVGEGKQVILYAVHPAGHAVMLPSARWDHFDNLWWRSQ